jgi:chemotaxis protein MotA
MEISTILGLVVGLGAIFGGLAMDGGSISELVSVSSVVIVVGGTIGASAVNFPMSTILSIPKLVAQSFRAYAIDPKETIDLMVNLADRARRDGLLTLEEAAQSIEDDFLRKGINLVVDGVDSATVSDILRTDQELASERHAAGIALLEAMGGYAPVMGMVGTVMGLVTALGNMNDPDQLGGAVAVAFLTTLYGALIANLFCLPIAGKLREKDEAELLLRRLTMEGVLAIQAGQSPRIVREKLSAFLPPSQREEA